MITASNIMLKNIWNFKYVLLEAKEWKEEVIDWQDPYATVTKRLDEVAIYPVQIVFWISMLFLIKTLKT